MALNDEQLGDGNILLSAAPSSTDMLPAIYTEMDPDGAPLNHLGDLHAAFENPAAALNEAAIVAVTDAQGIILAVNDKFCDISGYSAAELVGQNHRLLKSGAHDQAFFRDLYRTISRGETWRNTICNRAKDGHLYWVDTTIVANHADNERIIGFTTIRFDVTPLKLARQDLWARAHFDELTGAANRRHFLDLLTKRLAQPEPQPFYIAMLDLDHFKEVNDGAGHATGDELLKHVAAIVQSHLKPGELFGRLGGDEFVMAINSDHQNAADGEALNDLLCAILREIHKIDLPEFAGPRSTASFGLTRYPDHGNSAHQLMQRADLALYVAKKRGGDDWQSYQPSYEVARARTIELRGNFFRAFAADQIQLHYQPMVSLDPQRSPAFESLIRWIDDDGNALKPATFLELFDDDAVVREIGRFALATAITQIEDWTAAGLDFSLISVNATSPDLRSETFVAMIVDAIHQGRIQAHQLCIEITEGMLLDRQARRVRDAIDQISNLGVKIAFDDFGTGFASLTHLRDLPIDHVKIDRSFIQSLCSNKKDRVIVESIITLAHRLNLGVVAEGVEDEAQLNLLRDMGCDRFQGYLISQAVPADQALAFLQTYGGSTVPQMLRGTAA